MPLFKKRYRAITIAYWLLLVYILAALVWWFISLEQQNQAMWQLRTQGLQPNNAADQAAIAAADDYLKRKHAQYIGEGAIFLLLILVGAVLVFRAIRKELRLGRQQQNFMMAITHELKTPIAAARLNIETLRKYSMDEQRREKLLQNTLDETGRLNDLADNILLATRLDGQAYRLHTEAVDMQALLEEALEAMQGRYPRVEFVQTQREHTPLMVDGEKLLLKILINNLLENAVKYGKGQPPRIMAGCRQEETHVVLDVADNGPGISDAEKLKIFEKFYRIGPESSRGAKGTGLGLYLCKRIAEDHGGTIDVLDAAGGGARFLVKLPAETE